MSKLITEQRANNLADILKAICYLMTGLAVLTIVLVLIGRIEMRLTTPAGHYADALLLEKNHNAGSRFMYANLSDLKIYLNTLPTDGNIGVATWLGISLMGIATVAPPGYCFFLMARFFGNISRGSVFTAPNASLLLNGGAVLVVAALAAPLLNGYMLPVLMNQLTPNVVSTSVSINFVALFAGAILLVMAYVFHYGIYLQNEADHTL